MSPHKPSLPPLVHPLVQQFIENELPQVVDQYTSPLNIVFPQIFSENISALSAVLSEKLDAYEIFYAHKANQSDAFITESVKSHIGVDVASLGELDHALSLRVPPPDIEGTGPKSQDFLTALIKHSCIIALDSLDELRSIIRIVGDEKNQTVRVLLRLAIAKNNQSPSRFGFAKKEAEEALRLLQSHQTIQFLGFSFHIDSADQRDKIDAITAALTWTKQSIALGLHPTHLNIGGGLRQRFTADTAQWQAYSDALKRGLIGTSEQLALPGSTFGYRIEEGTVVGIPVYHKYGNDESATTQLRHLLDASPPLYKGQTVAQLLNELMLTLVIEPGKAAVDLAGVTVGTVISTKPFGEDHIITLDIKRDDITPVDQEVMLDPIIVSRHHEERLSRTYGIYLAGTLCLERDMVYRHKTFVTALPQVGDSVVFINTAAYQMDISASQALMHPRLQKLSATYGSTWSVRDDAEGGTV